MPQYAHIWTFTQESFKYLTRNYQTQRWRHGRRKSWDELFLRLKAFLKMKLKKHQESFKVTIKERKALIFFWARHLMDFFYSCLLRIAGRQAGRRIGESIVGFNWFVAKMLQEEKLKTGQRTLWDTFKYWCIQGVTGNLE